MKLRLRVYECEGKFFSTVFDPEAIDAETSMQGMMEATGSKEVFSIDRESDTSGWFDKLNEAAKEEARKRDIPHVMNLDD